MLVIPAARRHHWSNEWLDSWQSFPATGNFDLAANAHGVLMVNNDDRVDAGEGLDTHQHRNAEILTWVVEGALVHRDSRGNEGVIRPGLIQRMTAGRGITHSERNAATRQEGTALRVVQMWVAPDTDELEPGYAERDFTGELAGGQPVVVASGLGRDIDGSAITLANRYAALHVARPRAGQSVVLPGAPFAHLYVTRGDVVVEVGDVEVGDADNPDRTALHEGDALRLTADGEVRLSAGTDAEVLYWEMYASFDL